MAPARASGVRGRAIPLRSEEVGVTLLLVGIVAWVLLAVFVCSLGCAAKAGDRLDLEGVRGSDGPPSRP